ncbi:3-methyl-2-oxobutanoate hydroxymethyltransferase [Tenuibacillus multivorans]|uniref:3-methyl-2-oxobutanoate hydroxymethyltransferase n=1 Tax=Tenuibacillus multivorans TaxID=237069 RepID=A0A1H0CSX3_9BACI|nr:3-methyl-2-oxobutanoate hydroxymethyltransferase [Tenuibacillus multivorans]GEL76176.1 3-methyl-2-oxobutanoate hydroxymethyltransferase [Tenuibacillus multivorans]SDN60964.1 3-methyl-2-oxobutanoate hydroxymethyltransferase [Tenuibacillus multivorans]
MKTYRSFLKMKNENVKIAMMTAYDYPSAKMSEEAEVDMILVGDSLGMVVLGYDSTIPVTIDDMIHHGKAVRRGAPNTFTTIDMPFMSFNISRENTLHNAKRIFQETGAQALKIEGGKEVVEVIQVITQAGIPIVGHIGLTPQSVHVLGGYRIQGKTHEDASRLIEEAKAVERAGAIALVLECVPEKLAKIISEQVSIPTIGIGAGKHCDGQVLVYHDLLQYGVERLAKFVKPYADMNQTTKSALEEYVNEVKQERFPKEEHTYPIDEEALVGLYGGKS